MNIMKEKRIRIEMGLLPKHDERNLKTKQKEEKKKTIRNV